MPVTCAFSGPPYCSVQARSSSFGAGDDAAQLLDVAAAGADELHLDRLRARAGDLDLEPRCASSPGAAASCSSSSRREAANGEPQAEQDDEESHTGTTPVGGARHTGSVHPEDILRALRGGPATLDALGARLGAPARDALTWAVDDAVARGLVRVIGRRRTAGPTGSAARPRRPSSR